MKHTKEKIPPIGDGRLRFKWHLLYFVLAGFDLFAIGLISYINHIHLQEYGNVVASNAWTFKMLDDLAELMGEIQRVNAPGNDIFDSHDPILEHSRFLKADKAFEASYLAIKSEISQVSGTPNDPIWSKELNQLYIHMTEMRQTAESIFKLFEVEDERGAGALMAEMDRRYGRVLYSVEKLRTQLGKRQKEILEFHEKNLVTSRQIEFLVALFVSLAIAGVTFYGSRMAKFMRQSIIASEKHKKILNALDKVSIIAYTDPRGVIKEVNENFCKVSGYSPEELIGKTHDVVNSGAHSKEFFRDLWQTIAAGRIWTGEIENRAKDGHHYIVRTVITPIEDASGKISEYMAMRIDVTKQHEAERALEVEKVKAIRNAKLASLGEMSAGIAHEINNPLTIIYGTVRALPKFVNNPEQLADKIKNIQSASERIGKIVKSLRKFSRTSEKSDYKVHSLCDIIKEAVVLTEAKSQRHSTKVEVECQSECQVFCDEIEIEQVFVNLISNAVDAVKILSEKWVVLQLQKIEGLVVLRIRDSGPRISSEIQKKLFQPFFTTKPVGQGTGLGLSIAKGILDEHHATIELVADDPYTCFEIRFPEVETKKHAS